MLRLDRITLHNFKSFRHANINFSKGFNCIVGPNGSGKSNICDALLFAMGESSLKRMRVSSAKGLINAMAKPVKSDGVRRAYTTVAFTGDENIEISRIIKSNNKISYRINGKRSTRQQVLDLLKAHKAELNETNTIIQGEITKILNLSARERRSLIDIAAGISEFDEKREAAQKELEKVDAKINEANIMLGERQAFLNELEKEKSDAERYLELQAKIKKTTYTMLKAREEQISGEYKNVVEGYDRLTNRRKSLEAEIKKLDDELSSVTSYKEKLVKKMNEGSIELSTANKMLDETSSNIRIQENLIRQIEESIANGKERIKGLKEESESITKKLDSNAAEMAMLKSALASAEKELAKHAIDEHSSGKEIIARYSELQKELLGIEGVLSDINSECISRNSELSKLQDGLSAANSEIERMEAERKALDESYKKLQKELKAELDKLQAGRGRLQDINAKIGEQNIAASKFDTELINLREQLALSGKSQDRITPILKAELKKGFYGRASELLKCDDEYAVAVYASTASRLNYYVVDSIETASRAIEIIKAKNLGRASFIPINEIRVARGQQTNLQPLINKVSFDEKYRKAFEYIFANTYLVDSITGLGKSELGAGRFVTLEGELVEQSGVVTGGRFTAKQLPRTLESALNKMTSDRKAVAQKIAELEKAGEEARKEISQADARTAGINAELKHAEDDILKIKAEMSRSSRIKIEALPRISEIEKANKELTQRKIEAEQKKEEIRAEADRIHELLSRSSQKGSSQDAQKGLEEANRLRASVEETKIKLAEFEKENQMHTQRRAAITKEVKQEEAAMKDQHKRIAEAERAIMEYGKRKGDVEAKIKAHGTASDSLLKEVQQLDEKLSKMGFQEGKASNEVEKVDKEMIETEGRRSQLQTRLSDIKAELISYQDVEAVEYKSIEELERQATESKHELELLGSVNLKAPEAYAQRKKDVEEARGKMDVLDKEKSSILGMISEIESRKLSVFNQTFEEVNKNFQKLYNTVFEGSAYIYLDGSDPFTAKLMFNVQNGGKRRTDEGLSGGEKSILMLSLIFSIQMRKPMAFYIFDEIDAALDRENSKKLSKLVRELAKTSQFIVGRHNDSLITMAEAAIGVARQEGYSRAVGIEMVGKNGVVIGKGETR